MALGWRGQYYRYKGFFLNIVNLYKQRAELRAFAEVIFSIVTITVFLLFALKPTILTIIGLSKEIAEKKDTIINLDKKISDLQKASVVYQQYQDAFPNIDIAIADKPKPDTITKQIEGLAVKNSVSILGSSVGQVVLVGNPISTRKSSDLKPFPEGALEMPISINIKGEYPGIMSFITDLENLRIVTKIDSVAISSSEINGERVIVALISARVPYIQNQKLQTIK